MGLPMNWVGQQFSRLHWARPRKKSNRPETYTTISTSPQSCRDKHKIRFISRSLQSREKNLAQLNYYTESRFTPNKSVFSVSRKLSLLTFPPKWTDPREWHQEGKFECGGIRINGHTSSFSPEKWSRCFSSAGPDCVWSAGWSRSLHHWCRRLHHAEAHRIGWARMLPALCAAQCHAASPKHTHNKHISINLVLYFSRLFYISILVFQVFAFLTCCSVSLFWISSLLQILKWIGLARSTSMRVSQERRLFMFLSNCWTVTRVSVSFFTLIVERIF